MSKAAPTFGELIDLIRAYCERYHPGDVVVRLRLCFLSGTQLLAPIVPAPGRRAKERRHSEDYRSICWDGEEYTLTHSQAAVVGALWRAWEAGTPELSQAHLLVEADSQAERLRDLFRDSPLWGTVVVPGSARGTFRLAD